MYSFPDFIELLFHVFLWLFELPQNRSFELCIGYTSDLCAFGFSYWPLYDLWWSLVTVICHCLWFFMFFRVFRSCFCIWSSSSHLLPALPAAFRWEMLLFVLLIFWCSLTLYGTHTSFMLPAPSCGRILSLYVWSWSYNACGWQLGISLVFRNVALQLKFVVVSLPVDVGLFSAHTPHLLKVALCLDFYKRSLGHGYRPTSLFCGSARPWPGGVGVSSQSPACARTCLPISQCTGRETPPRSPGVWCWIPQLPQRQFILG